jgi:hypothetical protein
VSGLFEPQQDGFSRHEVIFRAIKDRPTGTIIPYHELPYDRLITIGLRTSVAKIMEREQQRTVVCVRGEGWRIVAGSEHVDTAVRARRRSTRLMGRAVQLAQTVNRKELSGDDQVRADAELIRTTTAYSMQRGLASRRLGIADVRAWREQRKERVA